MATESFNLGIVDNVVYNGVSQVDTVVLNDVVIWERDVTPPNTPSWIAQPLSVSNDTNPTWTWSAVSDAVSYKYRRTTNGVWSDWVSTTSTTYSPTLSGNPVSTYQVQVKAYDDVGNDSGVLTSNTITIDTIAPSAPAFTSQPPLYGHTAPTWSWNEVSGADGYRYRLKIGTGMTIGSSWGAWSGWSVTRTYTNSVLNGIPQTFILQIQSKDSAGNTSDTRVSTTYEFSNQIYGAPNFSAQPSSPGNDTTPTWSWPAINKPGGGGVDELVRYSYRLSSNAGSTYGNWSELSTSLSYTPTLVEGDYKLQLRFRNRYGKLSMVADSNIYVLDTTKPSAPSFSAEPSSPGNDTTPTWSWSEVSGADGYRRRLKTGSNWGSWSGWSTSRTYTPTLSTNTTYILEIQSKDSAGNTSDTRASSSYILDTSAPPAPNWLAQPSSPGNDTTPTWSWSEVSGADGYRRRLKTGSNWGSWSGWSTSRTYTPTLSTNTTYILQIQSKDSAGNARDIRESSTYVLDTTKPSAPSFSAEPPSTGNDTTPTWSWNTVSGANGYRRRLKIGTSWGAWSGWSTTRTYTPTLSTNTTYILEIQSKDSAGNTSDTRASSSYILDTTKPSAPSFSAEPSSPGNDTTPTWSWNTVSGANGYRRRLKTGTSWGAWSGWSTSRTYTPTLSTNTTYILEIQSKDSAGNTSDTRASSSYILDTVKPGTVSPSTQDPTNNPRPTWTWSAESGMTYEVRLNPIGNSSEAEKKIVSSGSYTPTVNCVHGNNHLIVVVIDAAGNRGDPIMSRVFVDLNAPPAPVVTCATPLIGKDGNRRPTWTWTIPSEVNESSIKQYGLAYSYEIPGGFAPAPEPEFYQTGQSFQVLADIENKDINGASHARGFHTLSVRAQDQAGNWGPVDEFTVELDTSGPIHDKPTVTSPTTNWQPTFTWTTPNDSARCRYKLTKNHTNGNTSEVYDGETTSSTWKPPAALNFGSYTFSILHYDEAGNSGHLGWRTCDVIIRVEPPSFSLTGDKAGPDQPIFNVTVPNRGYQVIYRTIYDKGGGRNTTSWNLIGWGNSGTVLTCTPPVYPKRFDGDANNKENTIELQASADPFYKGLDFNHDLSKGFESITASAVVSHTIIVDNTTPNVPSVETIGEFIGFAKVIDGIVYHSYDSDIFVWPKDDNATKYRIKFAEDGDTILLPSLEELESDPATPAGHYSYRIDCPINAIYSIYVSAGNDIDGNWSAYGHKSINRFKRHALDNNLMDTPVVTGPAVTNDNQDFTWAWQSIAGAERYRISVANTKDAPGIFNLKTSSHSNTFFTYFYNTDTWLTSVDASNSESQQNYRELVLDALKEKRAELNLDNVETDGHYNNHTFSIRVYAVDKWSNVSDYGQHNVLVDLTAPGVPSPMVIGHLETNKRPTWTWDPVSGALQYGLKLNNNVIAMAHPSPSWQPGFDLPDGTNTLCVRAKDSAGNWSDYGCSSVNITSQPANYSPAIVCNYASLVNGGTGFSSADFVLASLPSRMTFTNSMGAYNVSWSNCELDGNGKITRICAWNSGTSCDEDDDCDGTSSVTLYQDGKNSVDHASDNHTGKIYAHITVTLNVDYIND